jgi:purine-binding chemotaxis protein CheW
MDADQARHVLVCRVRQRRCAIPIEAVVETMRSQPIERLPDTPPGVLGVAVIRGVPTPVVDVAGLLGERAEPTRLVTIRVDRRIVALAFDAIDGVTRLAPAAIHEPQPLLQGAAAGAISAIGELDRELVLMLETMRLLPDVPEAGA